MNSTPGFRRFRRLVLLCFLSVGMLTGVAYANGGGLLGVFDLTDSSGNAMSAYKLAVWDGGITEFSFQRAGSYWVISLAWSLYVGFIGVFGWLLDWTVGLGWVGWLVGPVSGIEQTLRANLLEPIGATRLGGATLGLLGSVGVGIGLLKARRSPGAGWADVAWTVVASALAVGILASPVALVVGSGTTMAAPLRTAQQMGIGVSSLVTKGSSAPVALGQPGTVGTSGNGSVTVASPAASERMSTALVDAFVRPVHQQMNFGTTFDDSLMCKDGSTRVVDAYNKLLKEGADGKQLREKMGDCDKKYQDFADNAAEPSWLIGFTVYEFAVLLIGALLLTFTALMWAAVLSLMWTCLVGMFHVLGALVPGESRSALVRDAVSVVANLIYITVNMLALAVVMKMITWSFTSVDAPLQVRFIVADIVLAVGIALLVMVWRNKKATGKRVGDRLARFFSRDTGGRTRGSSAALWAGSAANTVANQMRYRSTRSMGTRAMRSAGRAAALAGKVVPPAAGAAAAVQVASRASRVRAVAQKAKTMGSAAGTAVRSAGGQMRSTYRQARAGDAQATMGGRVADAAMWSSSRAHNHLASKVAAAKTVAGQARQGRGRATTGSRVADRMLTGVGRGAAAADQVGRNVSAAATKVAAPVAATGRKAAQAGRAAAHGVAETSRHVQREVAAQAAAARRAAAATPVGMAAHKAHHKLVEVTTAPAPVELPARAATDSE